MTREQEKMERKRGCSSLWSSRQREAETKSAVQARFGGAETMEPSGCVASDGGGVDTARATQTVQGQREARSRRVKGTVGTE